MIKSRELKTADKVYDLQGGLTKYL